jgi:predicted neuraminidase
MKLNPILKEFVFEDNRPFNSCHASTLTVLPNGEVLAAWFGGTREGADDVAIWYSRRSEGVWSYPVKVADEEGIPHWNPVLFKREDGIIFLYYKVGHKIPKWSTRFISSSDDGHTWTTPRPLVEGDVGGRGPVKNKPILLKDGTMASPASIEGENWDAFADLSYDQGITWIKSNLVPIRRSASISEPFVKESIPVPLLSFKGKGVIQPTLWESEPGKVHMLLRSTEGKIYRSDSLDSGKTWREAYPTNLPNNNSGIDLVKLENGNLVLVFNPVGENWGKRTPLILSVSKDNGESWIEGFILEKEEGEYSYPAIVACKNELFITYTWKRERIAFWKLGIN